MTKKAKVMIGVASGGTYAIVLGKLQKKADPDDSKTRKVEAGPTKKGDILIKIGASPNKAFVEGITPIVGDMGQMQSVDRRITSETRDLNYLHQNDEVLTLRLKETEERKG